MFVVGLMHGQSMDRASVTGRTWAGPHQVCLFRHAHYSGQRAG